MSNAAFIDGDGNVTDVIVVPTNATICPTDGLPIALQGVNATLGQPQYVMTNYAGGYRGKYAGIGDTYDPVQDKFISNQYAGIGDTYDPVQDKFISNQSVVNVTSNVSSV